MSKDLPFETASALWNYDPETGVITRRVNTGRWGQLKAGTVATFAGGPGYLQCSHNYRHYYAHRIAWTLLTGETPKHDIDHINGVKTDNRAANLRDVDKAVNLQNQRGAPRNNRSSGMLGVSKAPKNSRKPWRAQINVEGRAKHLGTFDTPEQAHAAYIAAKREHHPGCTL